MMIFMSVVTHSFKPLVGSHLFPPELNDDDDDDDNPQLAPSQGKSVCFNETDVPSMFVSDGVKP